MSVPSAMRLLNVVDTPATVGNRADGRSLAGAGHTTTLVGNDRYLWVAGARNGGVYVIDIADPAAPKGLGYFLSPAGRGYGAFTPGVVHDVDVDRYGDITLTGSGGAAVYRLGPDPLKPTLVADCDGRDHQDGSLQIWRIDRRAKRLVEVSSYDTPKGSDASGPLSQLCSSHWFTVNGAKVVADAWYGAGVRFVDVSNPRKPRPVGFWAGDSTIASQARFVPGRDDLVYVADYTRGLDVVQIDKGGRGAKTISAKDEVTTGAVPGLTFPVELHPHEDFGWVCAVPFRR